jgi:hypothetical protein
MTLLKSRKNKIAPDHIRRKFDGMALLCGGNEGYINWVETLEKRWSVKVEAMNIYVILLGHAVF